MQKKIKPLVIALSLLGIINVPAFADTSDSNSNTDDQTQLLQKITKRTEALQSEVDSLQKEIKILKTEQRKEQQKTHRVVITQTTQAPVAAVANAVPKVPALGSNQKEFPLYLLGESPLVIGGTPIVVSPYLGQRSAFDASDLVVQFPDQNIDLKLLQERQKIENAYQKANLTMPDNSLLDLSGGIQTWAFTNGPYAGSRSSDIDVVEARLDLMALINKWTTLFLSFDYDNTPPAVGPREANSRVYVNKAFATIGNLNDSPFYATMGQFFMPFGLYGSALISDPITQLLGQTKARGVLFGFNPTFDNGNQGIYGALFTYRGAAGPGLTSPSNINGGGANLDYTYTPDPWNIDVGASVITNLADSNGMQQVSGLDGATGAFPGFGGASRLKSLNHQVPAVNLHWSLGYSVYSITGGYITAVEQFSPANLSFNSHGAKPQAFHVEAMRTFTLWDKSSNFIVGYDFSKDALAILLPQQRYITGFNISIWRDTVESLEFRHDINYASSSIASGQGYTVSAGPGHTSDTLTFQLGVYF